MYADKRIPRLKPPQICFPYIKQCGHLDTRERALLRVNATPRNYARARAYQNGNQMAISIAQYPEIYLSAENLNAIFVFSIPKTFQRRLFIGKCKSGNEVKIYQVFIMIYLEVVENKTKPYFSYSYSQLFPVLRS